jgi:hypothetical protein
MSSESCLGCFASHLLRPLSYYVKSSVQCQLDAKLSLMRIEYILDTK